MSATLHRDLAIFVCLLAALLLASGCERPRPCPGPYEPEVLPFILGVSNCGSGTGDVPYVAELGVRYHRPHIFWREVEPEILVKDLRVEDVDADPQMVHDYIDTMNWERPDQLIAAIIDAGMTPFINVGLGFTFFLPTFEGQEANPDWIGKENYIGHLYLHIRAVVERYNGDGDHDAPGGLVVKHWQVEGELNQAFLTALFGWRTPSFAGALGCAWKDWDFLTDIISNAARAVKVEDPEALTTTSIHSDIHPNMNHLFRIPTWREAIAEWRDHLDIIGIDLYPNYYIADPPRGDWVGERVREAIELGCGKPVVVMETNYPSGPDLLGYTEEKQADYVQAGLQSAIDNQASGYFHFGIKGPDHHSVEISDEDMENLLLLGTLFEEGAVLEMLRFALTHMEYMEDHFIHVLQAVEHYWGIVRPDGTHKPAWDVIRAYTE